MLSSLHIENIAVIKELDVEFGPDFNVLTGETGAGKSILIDSINFLLGKKGTRELIRSGEEKAVVSAVFTGISDVTRAVLASLDFDADADEVFISRTLTFDGRTTAKIDSKSVSGSMLRDVGKTLIDIHGQNDNQALMQKANHIGILDSYAGTGQLICDYLEVYEKMTGCAAKIKSLSTDESEKARTVEMLRYQINDIESVKPKENEEEKLASERDRLANIEKISKNVRYVYRALKGSEKGASAITLLENSATALEQIGGIIPEAGEYAKKLTEFRYEIEDIAESAYDIVSDIDSDPTARLDKIESRLDAIGKLKRKYGATVADVLDFERTAKARLESMESSDEQIAKLESEYKGLKAEAAKRAAAISEKRRAAAAELVEKITGTLEFLDMPKVKFSVSVEKKTDENGEYIFDKKGYDSVEFLISTNPGEPLLPLAKIASGGELARIMLAVKSVISAGDGVNTVIFDEIDSGISGKTSRKVGIKLKEISCGSQVICVTHSAQIASAATSHFLISKNEGSGRAVTSVKLLSASERVGEISRIIGGIEITDSQRRAAAEMIEEAKSF